jgi:hypothetical protein
MKVVLPIDPFILTQAFGVNPQNYAQFGLKGHNGWDIKTKYSDTPTGKRPILATQPVFFYRKGSDPKGYGIFFEVITKTSKSTWKHTFGHCDSIDNFQTRNQGEKMAISDNTGNSTAAHLHWTVKRITVNADGSHTVINYNNGYFGAVNPQEYIDEVKATPDGPQPPMDNNIKKATQFDQVLNALKDAGYISDNDSNHYLDGQFVSLIKTLHNDLVSNRGRAGKWDQLCNKAGISGDSNVVTVEQLFEKIQVSGSAESLRQKILDFVKTA